MKLNEKYDPNESRLKNNLFFDRFETLLLNTFYYSPKIHTAYFSDNNLSYSLSNESALFFRQLYVKFDKKEGFENKIKSFLCKTNKNVLLVLGNVGWGKTTNIIKYFFYSLPQNEQISSKVLPIYIDLNLFVNDLDKMGKNEQTKAIFFEKILLPRIKTLFNDLLRIDNDDFWKYVKSQPEFIDLKLFEDNLALVYIDINTVKQKILEKRLEALDKPTLPLIALKYFYEIKNIQPVVIFDNADPLQRKVTKWLLWEVHSLAERYSAKIITCLRPETYKALFNDPYSLNKAKSPLEHNLHKPDLKRYLDKRLQYLIESSDKINLSDTFNGAITFNSKTAFIFLHNFLRSLLVNNFFKIFGSITNYNLRYFNALIIQLLQSGYIDENTIQKFIMGNELNHSSVKRIVFSSLITNNYKTYFPNTANAYLDSSIINLLYYNSDSAFDYTIQLHLLAYACRIRKFTLNQCLDDYMKLTNSKLPNSVNLFKKILTKLNNANILNTTLIPTIYNYEEINPDEVFTATDTANIYLNEFLTSIEYLSFMKDDIDFGVFEIQLKDSIEIQDRNSSLNEILKYLKFLFEREIEFFNNLLTNNMVQAYLNYFSPSKSIMFFTKHILDSFRSYFNLVENKELIAMYDKLDREAEKMNFILMKKN